MRASLSSFFLVLSLGIVVVSSRATTYPPSVQKSIADTVGECDSGGKPRPNAVQSADFDGDGQPDYVIVEGNFSCPGDAIVYAGGTGGSGVEVLLSAQGYRPNVNAFLAFGVTIDRQHKPALLKLAVRTGDIQTLGWRGGKFAAYVSGDTRTAAGGAPAKPRHGPIVIPLRTGDWVDNEMECSDPGSSFRYDGSHLWVADPKSHVFVDTGLIHVHRVANDVFELKGPSKALWGGFLSIVIISSTSARFVSSEGEPSEMHWCAPGSLPADYH